MQKLKDYIQENRRLVNDLYKTLSEVIDPQIFNLRKNELIKGGFDKMEIDLTLYKKGNRFMAISVKNKIREKASRIVDVSIHRFQFEYSVLSDARYFYIHDHSSVYKKLTAEEFKRLLQTGDTSLLEKEEKEAIKTKEELKNDLMRILSIDTTDIEEDEKKLTLKDSALTKILDKQGVPEVICRYVSLSTFFKSIKHQKYQMSSMAGMNDRTEGQLAYDRIFLSSKSKNLTYEQLKLKRFRKNLNDYFMMCCNPIQHCDLKCAQCKSRKNCDNLTFWRLYGDDSKGVCLLFTVKKELLDKGYTLHHVKYEDFNSNDSIISQLYEFNEEAKKAKIEIDLCDLYMFIKPDHFRVEDEIRLLYKSQEQETLANEYDWILTDTNSIINRTVRVSFDRFPLQLIGVILGPNMPDADTNLLQIEEMLGDQKIIVTDSRIDSYRQRL